MTTAGTLEQFLPLQQSPVYAAALRRLGARAISVELDCGRALVIQRGRLRMVMRGPVWTSAASVGDRRRALRKLARWCGITVATPEEALSGFGLVPLVTPMHHAIWTLAPDLRAGMARNWSGSLRKAENAGHLATTGTSETLDLLVDAEVRQRASRGYQSLPPAFTRALPAETLRLWQWHQRGELQAAMAFIRHGSSASYHLGWGSDQARAAGIHALMLTRAAESLAQEGVRWLDLGLVDGESTPGLARFKLGTGATLRRLGATFLVLP